MISIRKYETKDKMLWNEFVASAKNATFLFNRDFMDYHNDKFEDYSLLCFIEDKLVGLLPANLVENKLYSHQGLTYGGLIVQSNLKFEAYIFIFQRMLEYLFENGIKQLFLKEIPEFYTTNPSEEFTYLQFLLKADIVRVDVSSVVKNSNKIPFSKDRVSGCKRANKYNLEVKEEESFDLFWNEILIPNLHLKHKVTPVHSLEEISLLKKRFPENIRQFNVYKNDVLVAGTTIFETKLVAHSQYISGNSDKNILGSLDFLHQYLITEVFNNKPFFDFGISTENQGTAINKGLLYWKEGFGARTATYKTYKINTENYTNLSTVLI